MDPVPELTELPKRGGGRMTLRSPVHASQLTGPPRLNPAQQAAGHQQVQKPNSQAGVDDECHLPNKKRRCNYEWL